MKQGFLILAHGSRAKEAETTLNRVVEKMRKVIGSEFVEKANMELSGPDIFEGIANLVQKGVSRVVVVPMFLFQGHHIQHDIPRLIQEAEEKFSQIDIKMARHIDADDRLVQILVDRAREALN
jgi:sirohydrochlorin cobaltochelatase